MDRRSAELETANTSLPGVVTIRYDPAVDERGSFARVFSTLDFESLGLRTDFVECSVSVTLARGTVRGLHFQAEPGEETKLVRCIRGAVFDVVVDVRRDSPTRGQWEATELDEKAGRAVYIPEGFAHGYQSLTDEATLLYLISAPYDASLASGYAHDDPDVGIRWPEPVSVVSPRDRRLPRLNG